MKILSLFSGIGAFEKALDVLKILYELAGYCEIDKYASKSYSAIHDVPETMNLGDITKIDEKALPKDIDLITYGFPCQDISLAGKQKGLFNEDGSQTRSGLFFEALRIIEETQPRVAIAENVKNLTGKKFNAQFQIVLASLEAAGYNNYWQVLNAKDYGIPQNRERVFIVSIRKDIDKGSFKFPEPFPLELMLKDMLEDEVDEKYYLSDVQIGRLHINSNAALMYDKSMIGLEGSAREYNEVMPTITSREWKEPRVVNETRLNEINMIGMLDIKGNEQVRRVYGTDGISPTLNTMQGGNRQPKVAVAMRGRYNEDGKVEQNIEVSDRELANAITTVQKDSLIGEPVIKKVCQINSSQDGVVVDPTIQKVDIPQTVRVRKYPVDKNLLCECLRDYKLGSNFSNKNIAETLNVPLTKVEHWFRQDDCFSIPDPELWLQLKDLLGIETDEFDEAIMTFEEKEGVFEKSERHYFTEGIAPTLTSTTADEKIIEPNLRIRKLTPKECFRLMGFTDEDFAKAEAVNSNTQLYKQAGNSIVVDVIAHILKELKGVLMNES